MYFDHPTTTFIQHAASTVPDVLYLSDAAQKCPRVPNGRAATNCRRRSAAAASHAFVGSSTCESRSRFQNRDGRNPSCLRCRLRPRALYCMFHADHLLRSAISSATRPVKGTPQAVCHDKIEFRIPQSIPYLHLLLHKNKVYW